MTWQTKKLDDACEVEYGTRVVNKKHGGSKYPVYGGGGATFFMDRSNRKDRMVIARFAMSEQCTRFVSGEFFLNDSGLTLSPKNNSEIAQDFLNWEVLFLNDHIYSLARGSAQKNLDVPAFRKMVITYPNSIAEQKRIVKKLNEVFEKVATAKANAEKNLQNPKELFESYLQSVFAKPGKDWEEKKLVEVCELKSGTTIPLKLEKQSGDVLYVKVGDMNLVGNEIEITTSSRFINSSVLNHKQIIPQGSVIFPKRGGAIFTNKRRKIIKPTIVDLNTMALVPSELIDSDLLYYWFLRIDLRDLNNGSSIPQINNYSFDNVLISYPKSLSEQKAIVKKLNTLSEETKKLEKIYEQKLADLEELKKSVLSKAFHVEL